MSERHLDGIFRRYRSWLNDMVAGEYFTPERYSMLINSLNDIQFYYVMQDDRNRLSDGKDLKYTFAFQMGYNYSEVDVALNEWCSVNEMLIALAYRCEHHIMHDDEYGDRTGLWYRTMLENMGLIFYDDENFNQGEVDRIVTRFLNREYAPDGHGGIVVLEDSDEDLRECCLWDQQMKYLTKYIEQEKAYED